MKAARRGERRRILLMDENNENQPAPVEAAAADPVLPEPRQHRPRRRSPRRRYRDRGERSTMKGRPNIKVAGRAKKRRRSTRTRRTNWRPCRIGTRRGSWI